MKRIYSPDSLTKLVDSLRKTNKTIGLVPTMGALHQGHASLITRSRRENDVTILSIFVNPAQFGPTEDFNRYPRTEIKDELLAKNNNVDIMFCPTNKSIYPSGYLTFVRVERLESMLCGAKRKGHFKGVATIVAKLLNIAKPDKLYMGQKDAQQSIIIQRMIKDLNFPVKLKICPTIREKDGLAVSSRNIYLSQSQRIEAPVIFKTLSQAKLLIKKGNKDVEKIKKYINTSIEKHSSAKVEYVDCVKADDLSEVLRLKGRILIAVALKFGKTRLIDNIIVSS